MLAVIDQDVAGSTDANGNATLNLGAPSPTMWGALKATIETVGSPRWAINVSGGRKAFARGERIDVPFVVQPAQHVTIQVEGANPNQLVSGKVHGMAGTTLDEISPFISQTPNAISLETAAPPVVAVSIPNGDPTIHTVPVGPGAVAVGYAAPSLAVAANTQIQISGHQTGLSYISDGGSQISFRPQAEPLDGADTSIDCQVLNGAGPGNVDFLVWTMPMVVFVKQRPADVLSVVDQRTGITATKTGFQAVAGGGNFVIIAASPGVVLTVIAWVGILDTSAVGAQIQFEDTNGANLIMYDAGGAPNAYQPWTLARPKVLPSGVGVRVSNPGTGNTNIAGTLYTL